MDAGACAERGSRVKRDGTANFWNLGQEMSHSDIALSQEEICISNDWISYEKKMKNICAIMRLRRLTTHTCILCTWLTLSNTLVQPSTEDVVDDGA